MPAKLERCVKKVTASGKAKSNAYAICQSSLKKSAMKKKTAKPKPAKPAYGTKMK